LANAIETNEYQVHGPSRREFIARSTLAAVVTLLSSCGDGEIGGIDPDNPEPPAPPPLNEPFTIRIADFPALQTVGGIARVDRGGSAPIALARIAQSTFAALSMVCPHAGYKPISIISGGFRCPNHGARFDSSGHWIGGQRTRDLQSYPTTYNAGTGTVSISVA
jgi:nitrite reductase/ring-hydroxylating ferredoxin subunit